MSQLKDLWLPEGEDSSADSHFPKGRLFQTILSDAQLSRRGLTICRNEPGILHFSLGTNLWYKNRHEDILVASHEGNEAFYDYVAEISNKALFNEKEILEGNRYFFGVNHLRNAKDGLIFAFNNRILELKSLCEDDEVEPNENSIDDGRRFLQTIKSDERPGIFILDNGNLKLLWTDGDSRSVGAEFLGNSLVRYSVIVETNKMSIRMFAESTIAKAAEIVNSTVFW